MDDQNGSGRLCLEHSVLSTAPKIVSFLFFLGMEGIQYHNFRLGPKIRVCEETCAL